MTVLLGGGGDTADERPVIDRFIELTGCGPIAYWPVALDLDDYTEATAFVSGALGRPVSTWERLDRHGAKEIAAQVGVFIGGGNTFRLLNEIRRAGMAEALRAFAATGVVYGGSAGAIVLGGDVSTAGFFDRNEIGLTDTTGLALIGRHAVWCHFVDGHLDPLRDWIRQANRPVLALSERAGAEINGTEVTSIGHEPLVALNRDGKCSDLSCGQRLSLAF